MSKDCFLSTCRLKWRNGRAGMLCTFFLFLCIELLNYFNYFLCLIAQYVDSSYNLPWLGRENVLTSLQWLLYLRKLWKSAPSSTPRAGHTPRGVAHRPGAVGFLLGRASAQGQSRLRSRLAHTACHKGAAALLVLPLALFLLIVFLQTRESLVVNAKFLQ